MQKLRTAMMSASLLALSTPGLAQVAPTLVELEGPIDSVTCTVPENRPAGTPCEEVELEIMGTTVVVRVGIPVASPSTELTLDQLASSRRFAGRDEDGFVGGTGKLTGVHDATLNKVVADNVLVEVSENVILGEVTANAPARGNFRVEDTRIVLMPPNANANSYPRDLVPYDNRYPGIPMLNDYGFRIRPGSIPVGNELSAEGYYADGLFYAFTIEVTGGTILNETTPQASILRAQCRERGAGEIELDIRGAVYIPPTLGTFPAAGVPVRIFSPARAATENTPRIPAVTYGTSTALVDAGPFGLYRFDEDLTGFPNGCPASIRAEIPGPYRSPVTIVDIRL